MAKTYAERKAQVADINRRNSQRGRDIAPLPKVAKPKRRESCRLNFQLFCETYFAPIFDKPWSDDHLKVISIIEDSVLRGGLFAVAMPRGSGKSALSKAACCWSILYGHRSFVVVIGATEDAATEILSEITGYFETNELIIADFPHACYPIISLEGINNRANGQLCDGEQTRISLTAKELVMPTVKGSCCCGSVIRVAGITGRIRGMSALRSSDGKVIRPDLVIIDDPQTEESAYSVPQTRKRLATVSGAILGLAGPGKKIAGVMPITVIARGDMADQVLDRKKHPIWQGERIKMLRSLPTNGKLWEEYAEHRVTGLQQGRGLTDATAFYKTHQIELDEGAEASWVHRFNHDELSAIQNAMNLKLTDEGSFFAEYQNEPLAIEQDTPLLLMPEQVLSKVIDVPRGIATDYATKLTAFIDVQGTVLFYAVCAWGNDFKGHVIDYGTFPEQPTSYFALRDIPKTFDKSRAVEGEVRRALNELSTKLLERTWIGNDGRDHRISRLFVDAGYLDGVVKQFAKESKYSALIMPTKGIGITADRKPMDQYEQREGDRSGWNWRQRKDRDGELHYDTNAWKTFLAQRLLSVSGEAGNLSIFHGSPVVHRLFAEHLTSEYPTPTEGYGRTVNVWKHRPNRENHLLDCIIGCAAAASEQGILFVGHEKQVGNKAANRHRRRLDVKWD